tara:strand:- start:2768 stop:2872 length:105 start_codon:yes stop_codon:yes gene_type:complete
MNIVVLLFFLVLVGLGMCLFVVVFRLLENLGVDS